MMNSRFEEELKAEQKARSVMSGALQNHQNLIDFKLGDAQMSYIQYVIQEQNVDLFKQIMATVEG